MTSFIAKLDYFFSPLSSTPDLEQAVFEWDPLLPLVQEAVTQYSNTEAYFGREPVPTLTSAQPLQFPCDKDWGAANC